MKQIIRLTESDLHRIVRTAVNEILKNVPNTTVSSDGNSMTGGEYGGSNISQSSNIKEEFWQELVDCAANYAIEEEEIDALINFLDSVGAFNIKVVGNSSYDSSTGYGNRFSPVTSIHDSGLGELKNAIRSYQGGNPDLIEAALEAVDKLDTDIVTNPKEYGI